jgi:UDP-glucose 4-epimerase
MTRFLMSLQESVELVKHAFINAEPGDLFVRKAPASTVDVLARAVASLFGNDNPEIAVIGTRHGEKLHETLLSTEEMVKSTDQGEYYRVPLDARSLEYELYYEEGDRHAREVADYTSANTERLDLDQTKALVRELPEVRKLLGLTHA